MYKQYWQKGARSIIALTDWLFLPIFEYYRYIIASELNVLQKMLISNIAFYLSSGGAPIWVNWRGQVVRDWGRPHLPQGWSRVLATRWRLLRAAESGTLPAQQPGRRQHCFTQNKPMFKFYPDRRNVFRRSQKKYCIKLTAYYDVYSRKQAIRCFWLTVLFCFICALCSSQNFLVGNMAATK